MTYLILLANFTSRAGQISTIEPLNIVNYCQGQDAITTNHRPGRHMLLLKKEININFRQNSQQNNKTLPLASLPLHNSSGFSGRPPP